MRRMFFVGCGGTGGSVLAYVMDQLRAEFAHAGLNGIPAAWQFVHVDVPRTCDTRIPGVRNVPDQGGTYIDVGPFDPTYKSAELLVTQAVAAGDAGTAFDDTAMGQLGSWLPRNPSDVRVPLSDGAGQMRQVGRIATLSSLPKVQQQLRKAWDAMSSMQARAEGPAAAEAMPQLSQYAPNDPPVIFVVSSMAGGAGASMVLDICRLTAELPGAVPDTTAVFVATASVFESLGEGATRGVLPNTLAMFGELLAAQSGSAGTIDSQLIRALGVGGGDSVTVPFTRILPIGNKVGLAGNVATFGDGTQRTVYRGLGRAISALVTSDAAFEPWVSYVVGNPLPTPQRQDLAAWGGDRQAHQWQGFGYASVSMGRDRYLHYAAQRLAHATVDHLLTGHFTSGDSRTAEQAVNELVAARWDLICERVGLPARRGDKAEFQQWAQELFRQPWQEPSSDLTGSLDGVFLQTAGAREDAGALRQAIQGRLANAQSRLKATVDSAGYRLAFTWLEGLSQRVEESVVEEMAQGGLPYAQEVVRRLSSHLNEWVAEGLHHFVKGVGSVGEPPERAILEGLRGMVQADALFAEIRTRYRPFLANRASARAAEYVLEALEDSNRGLFTPLVRTLGNAVEGLRRRTDEPAAQLGLAMVDTDSYRAWPGENDHVSERWFTSVNERLLTSPATFPQQFRVDLPPAVEVHAGDQGFEAVRQRTVGSLIRGDWNVVGGDDPAGGPLVREHEWIPPGMVRIPDSSDTRVPSSGSYRLDVSPSSVLARAKAFVDRPGMPFRRFADVSLREYILEHDGSAQGVERAQSVLAAFGTALEAARPLVEVDGEVVRELHGTAPHIRYDLSEVPFAELSLSEDIMQSLRSVAQIDPEYLRGLEDASPFTANQYTTRIDIFGSYVAYSPLAFSGVLNPVIHGWTQAHQREGSATEFWRLRRARPLAAALPVTAAERQALVGGWFVGQLTGRVILPPRGVDDPVRIYSDAENRWLTFPHPRLRPLKDFRADYDYLPAILESMLLAMARFGESPVGSSMSPYRALRQMWDDDPEGPTNTANGIGVLAGERIVRAWLSGADVTGAQGVVSVIPGEAGSRREEGLQWVQAIRRMIGTDLMPSGVDGAPGGGTFSRVTSRDQAYRSPMLRDLGPDAWETTGVLEGWLTPSGGSDGSLRF